MLARVRHDLELVLRIIEARYSIDIGHAIRMRDLFLHFSAASHALPLSCSVASRSLHRDSLCELPRARVLAS